jgi:hypothetical protein
MHFIVFFTLRMVPAASRVVVVVSGMFDVQKATFFYAYWGERR